MKSRQNSLNEKPAKQLTASWWYFAWCDQIRLKENRDLQRRFREIESKYENFKTEAEIINDENKSYHCTTCTTLDNAFLPQDVSCNLHPTPGVGVRVNNDNITVTLELPMYSRVLCEARFLSVFNFIFSDASKSKYLSFYHYMISFLFCTLIDICPLIR